MVVLVGGWILFICIVRFFSLQFAGGICNLSIDSTLDAMRQRWDPNKDLFLDFFPLKRSERTRLTTCVYSFFWAGNGFRMVVYFFRVRVSVLCTRTPWEGEKGARGWRVDRVHLPMDRKKAIWIILPQHYSCLWIKAMFVVTRVWCLEPQLTHHFWSKYEKNPHAEIDTCMWRGLFVFERELNGPERK